MRVAAIGCLAVVACDATDEAHAPPPRTLADYTARITVTAHDADLRLVAYVRASPDEPLLDEGRVELGFRGATIAATLTTEKIPYSYDHLTYHAATMGLDAMTMADEPVTVTVTLGESVATSTVTLPPSFTIDGVTPDAVDPQIWTVTWSPSGSTEALEWGVHARGVSNHGCTAGIMGDRTVPDTGTFVADRKRMIISSMGFPCIIEHYLARDRDGHVEGFAAPSSIIGIQERLLRVAQ